jgi:Family of unknown function (DUF6093)
MLMGTIVTAADRAELQDMVEAEFDDTCRVKRRSGHTYDSAGRVVPTYQTVYLGPCRVKMTTGIGVSPARGVDTAEQHVTVTRVLLQLPVSAAGVRYADLVDVVDSTDPELGGHQYTIDGPYPGQTHGVARRYWLAVAT